MCQRTVSLFFFLQKRKSTFSSVKAFIGLTGKRLGSANVRTWVYKHQIALISISFPLRELCLALYLAFVQWHSNRQVSVTAGTKDEKRGRIRNCFRIWSDGSGQQSSYLFRGCVVWADRGPSRLEASSGQCMKKHPQHCGSLQGKNLVSGLNFLYLLEIKLNLPNQFFRIW